MKFVRPFVILCLLLSNAQAKNDAVGATAPADFSFQTTEGPKQIRSFRGKWLLLQFGASWCYPSEFSATVFSDVQRHLEKKPFVFVELNADPSLADVNLFSMVNFAGLRGLTPDDVPEPFDSSSMPHWYLIDPRGKIKAEGGPASAEDLRAEMRRSLPASFGLKPDSLDPDPGQQACEQAMALFLHEEYAPARDGFLAIFHEDPKNVDALYLSAWAEAFLTDPGKGKKFFDQNLPPGTALTDRQKANLMKLVFAWPRKLPIRKITAELRPKVPDSVYLAAEAIEANELPEDVAAADLAILESASRSAASKDTEQFLALVREGQNRTDDAFAILKAQNPQGWRAAQAIGMLTRHGKSAVARNAFFKNWPAGAKGNLSPQATWEGAFGYALLSDWPDVDAYGARYAAQKVSRPYGLELQWLAAIRLKDFAKADDLAKQVEARARQQPKYRLAVAAFEGQPLPDADAFVKGLDGNSRLDNLMPYALLAERAGNFEGARAAYRVIRRLFDTADYTNAMATHLSLTLGK